MPFPAIDMVTCNLIPTINLSSEIDHRLLHMQSVMERLAWLSSLRNPYAGRYEYPILRNETALEEADGLLRATHESCFKAWFHLSPRQQVDDLSLFLKGLPYAKCTVAKAWYATEFYRQSVPENAPASEIRLFTYTVHSLLATIINNGRALHEQRLSLDVLTRREQEVFLMICEGKSTKEISTALSVSSHTISEHRKRICHKLAVHSTAALVALGKAIQ